MMLMSSPSDDALAVLVSGGLDSAVLLGMAVRDRPAVAPIYVQSGLTWETVEREYLGRFLAAIASPALQPLVTLDLPVADLYGEHWSTGQQPAPEAASVDVAVYLPGRNVLLLAKSLVWCRLNEVPAVALAVLRGNPFPDATPEFFRDFAAVVGRAVGGAVRVETPFAGMTKVDVIRAGRDLPLRHTFSCLSPVGGRHCGACNKCAERARAFRTAGVNDPTEYADNERQKQV